MVKPESDGQRSMCLWEDMGGEEAAELIICQTEQNCFIVSSYSPPGWYPSVVS